jgi:hypothetical protein
MRKRFLLSFFLLAFLTLPCAAWGTTYPLTIDSTSETVDGDTFCSGVCQPGDIITLPVGTYNTFILFRDLVGTALNPIIVRNADNGSDGGGTIIDNVLYNTSDADNRYYGAIKISNCQHVIFSGDGDADVTYGIKLTRNVRRGLWIDNDDAGTDHNSDLEFRYFEISNIILSDQIGGAAIRIGAKRDYPIENFKIHHNYIHTTLAEAMYIGSAPTPDYQDPADCVKVISTMEIYNNIITDSGLDAIDVKCATGGVEIYGNTITNAGCKASVYTGFASHDEGIITATGTVSNIHGNFIDSAHGSGIRVESMTTGEDIQIVNNVVVDGYIGIHAVTPVPANGITNALIDYNTVISPSGYTIIADASTTGRVLGNLVVNDDTAQVITAGGTTATGNVTKATVAECNFVDGANDNYDLTVTSPFINSGPAGYPATDYLGRARPSGGAADPGAYEYMFTDIGPDITSVLPGNAKLYADGGAGWNNISVSSTVTDNLGGGLTYLWTFGIEYITNGTMEAPVSNDPPTGWTANNATLDDSATAHGGAQSIKVTNGAGGMSEAYQAITTIVDAKYRVSGWAYKAAATGVSLRASTSITDGAVIVGYDLDQSTDNTWFNLTFDFTATATTTYVQLGVYGSADDGTEFAYFDDITMDQISTVEDPSTITYPTPGSYPSSHTVTYLVTDAGDNTDQATFTVTINETSADDFSDILFWVNFDSGAWSTPTYTISSTKEKSTDTTGAGNDSVAVNADAGIVGTNGLDIADSNKRLLFNVTDFPTSEFRVGFYFRWGTFATTGGLFQAYLDATNYFYIRMLDDHQIHAAVLPNGATASQVYSGTDSVLTQNTAYFVEVACKVSTNLLAIYVNGSNVSTGRVGTLEAWDPGAPYINIGDFVGAAMDAHMDQVFISNDSTRDLYALRAQTILPSYARIGSIGNADIDGTYGIGSGLSVPVYFVDGLGVPKTVTLTDDGDTNHEAIITTETGATDLVLLHTSPALGTAASTHWFSTTATAGQAIASGMTSADLTVTAISDGDDTFDADLTLPTGENLSDNSAVVIAGTTNSITAFYLCDCSTGAQITDNTAITGEDEFCALMTFAVDSYFINGPTSNLTIPLLLDNGTLVMTPRDTQPAGMGNGTNEWVFSATASPGDRSASEVVVTAVGDFAHGATDIVDGIENALASYELPNAWLINANSLTVNVPYTADSPLTITVGGTYEIVGSFDSLALEGDHISVADGTTETGDVTFTVSVTINVTGTWDASAGTVTTVGGTVTGGTIECKSFSGKVTRSVVK